VGLVSFSPMLYPPLSLIKSQQCQIDSEGLAITEAKSIGSVCAAVTILLLVVIGIVMWILIKKHRQKRKQQTRSSVRRRYNKYNTYMLSSINVLHCDFVCVSEIFLWGGSASLSIY